MKHILSAGGLILGMSTMATAQQQAPVIDVLKQASCGCCGGWVVAMQEAGFTLNVSNVSGDELYAAKEASGISDDLWACHTATVAGYTIEGHVPAREIERLLEERPAALGIATPGMRSGPPEWTMATSARPSMWSWSGSTRASRSMPRIPATEAVFS